MDKWGWILCLILVINLGLAIYPALKYDLPVTQTDGATYYTLAKVYSEHGINAENPAFNRPGSLEKKVSDYPPFALVTFGSILNIFGHDTFWINGGYTAVFFLIATIFTYLLFLELTKDKKIALIGAAFSALNFRAYFSHLTGHFPFFVGFGLTIPALYCTAKYLNDKKRSSLILGILSTALVYLTYTPQAVFLTILQFGMAFGNLIEQKLNIKFPEIKIDWKKTSNLIKNSLMFFIPSLIIAAILTKMYLFAASGRQGFASAIIASLMKMGDGYPVAWGYFLIIEGPILFLFAIAGIIHIIRNNQWKILGLLTAAIGIVMVNLFVIPVGVFARYFIYRFYVTFFILLALPAAILIVKGLRSRQTRILFSIVLVLALLFNIAQIGFLYSKLEPAITQDELKASQFLSNNIDKSVLYIKNYPGDSSFRDFKWILIYSKIDNFQLEQQPIQNITQKWVLIEDYSYLTPEYKSKFDAMKTVFSSGNVVIKES